MLSLPYFPADHQMVSSLCHIHFLEPDSRTDLQLWFSPKLIRFVLEEDAHRDMANGMTHAVCHQSEIKLTAFDPPSFLNIYVADYIADYSAK